MDMYSSAMMQRGRPRRFDEYYRCYPIAMMPGPERVDANHGGKLFMPASALNRLTQLHITYPMLFEVINGAHGTKTHAGVLEFTAEEGRCYLPFWLMQTCRLEPGDLVQIKSTDLPLGSFIKLQPQDKNFLDISDPKAVLETAFGNFSCLTVGDVFTFFYNETTYEIAVLEVKPDLSSSHAISVQETDLEVDFAPPIGYEEPKAGASNGIKSTMAAKSGTVHTEGSMAKAINFSSIAPLGTTAAQGQAASAFIGSGGTLSSKGKAPERSVPLPASSIPTSGNRLTGPQPLRLPPGKLFFGYEVKPLKKSMKAEEQTQTEFKGEGQRLGRK
ncbi:UFD1-domain-containing protein [Piedraia hortae CBS 480.64]|uniref:Ubiquitin fusion degradation protein 1 n=1 Tax=Piedraia hortae CBS 480.64 TaxID=1314780 RepID=A0A6A7C095_9PEZI|nr:UFD1-domain-containing protein [Piedraia hortae CBS 480.64]